MNNEWELLEIAEEIEPGDYVIVEEDGEETRMMFVKYERGIVYLKHGDAKRKFRASSLEEIDGDGYITRKATEGDE